LEVFLKEEARMKIAKRLLAMAMAGTMVLSSVSVGFADSKDFAGHWAEKAIEKWNASGVINGYPDGSFMPDKSLTRAELATIINNVMMYQESTPQGFKDVPSNEWYASVVNKLATAKVISGFDNQFRPLDKVTRQEAAVILANAFSVKANNTMFGQAFNDSSSIDSWAMNAVSALAEKNYMNGRNGNMFDPKASLTRAEAVQLINNIVGELKNKPGTYSGTYAGNVILNVADANLKDATINGDLIIAPGVGEGNIELNNVTVKGQVIAQGGGENSLRFINTIMPRLFVNKPSGRIRLLAEGNTRISDLFMNYGARIQTQNLIGLGFERITVQPIIQTQPIIFTGNFPVVNFAVPNLNVNLAGGTISTLNIAPTAQNSNLVVQPTATITNLVANAPTEITGTGTVQNASVSVQGVSFETRPTVITGTTPNITVEVNNQTVTAPVTTPTGGTGTTGGTSGGTTGGSTGGSDNGSTTDLVALTGGTATVNGSGVSGTATANSVTFNFASNGQLQGVGLTGTTGATLAVTSVKSHDGTTTTVNKTITNLSNISVTSLLGGSNSSVYLSSLKGAFGNSVTVTGTLSATGYESRTVTMVMNFSNSIVASSNEYATMSESGQVLTATLKSGKDSVLVDAADPIHFIQEYFGQLPTEVKIGASGTWRTVSSHSDLVGLQHVATDLSVANDNKTYATLTLSDLVDDLIYFKTTAGGSTIYTLDIN